MIADASGASRTPRPGLTRAGIDARCIEVFIYDS